MKNIWLACRCVDRDEPPEFFGAFTSEEKAKAFLGWANGWGWVEGPIEVDPEENRPGEKE